MRTVEESKNAMIREYDLLANKFHQLYIAGNERGHAAMKTALEASRKQLVAAGEFSVEQSHDLHDFMSRDLSQTLSEAHSLGDTAKNTFNPSRLKAGALSSLASILEATGSAFLLLGEKTKENLTFKTGQVTSAGTLTCQNCQQSMHMMATGHIPPCPKCRATEFSKSY